MSLTASMVVCLPALAAVLAIGVWVWVDARRYNAEPEPPKPAAVEDWMAPEVGQLWVQSYPVETPTAEVPIVRDWGWAQ